ncbi:MAG TPA: glycosyltransferase family 1 protein [Candidatus Saccharimonadales bacterium]|nr:glycosyltransferase family 1 protein [Candidatus Saccharimonadales bacterium]
MPTNRPKLKKTKLFVEAVPLVDRQISGVPHALAGLVAALAANKDVTDKYEIVLVAPKNRMHLLDRWKGLESCTRKAIPMKFRVMNGLGRRGLLPPMDLLLGPGVYLFGNFFNWPLTKRSKSLTYIHDICFAVHPEFVQPDNQKSLAKNVPRYIRQTDYIITVSKSARQEIIDNFKVKPEQVLVVYNGVNTEIYKPYPTKEVVKVREKYHLKDQPYLLYIGNIEPRKNLERMVKAVKQLPKDHAMIMVGSDGWLNEGVFAAIDDANKAGHKVIKPRTYVPDEDVVRLISGATALVLPALYEGFGMPPLEAMASKTPVVVSDIPPLHEVANGAGIYCDPHKIDSIAAAMKEAIEMDPTKRQKLIDKGYKHAMGFTWERSTESIAKTLLDLRSEVSNK